MNTRQISSDDFGIETIKEGDRCLYRFGRGGHILESICIGIYQSPDEKDQKDYFNDHPGFVIVEESFSGYYTTGNRLQWSDDYFIKKLQDETLDDYPEYFI